MKTNVVMKSKDRILFDTVIKQQTKNKFPSVSDLQKSYDKARWQYGWSDRRVSDILQYNPTKEKVYHLLNERGVIKTGLPAFMEMVDKEGLIKVLKGLGVWQTTGRGENKSVYCDPYIWVMVAMELNPMIYAKVVIWLTDSLIFDRIEAGAEYMPMNAAIKSVVQKPDYSKYARAINESVFGVHQTGMRNLASAEELKLISDIEKFITQAINMGLLRNESDVLLAIKKFAKKVIK